MKIIIFILLLIGLTCLTSQNGFHAKPEDFHGEDFANHRRTLANGVEIGWENKLVVNLSPIDYDTSMNSIRDVVILEVWRKHIQGFQSPECLIEPALGGVDTRERTRDYLTFRYRVDGTQVWVSYYDGPGNSDDWITSLAVDCSGNVYVTGESDGLDSGKDYATVKYDPQGVQQWVARYNGPANSDDGARAVAVDSTGNVYVTGYSWDSETDKDFGTIKYNADGAQLCVARYNGTGNSDDEATDLDVDESGSIYVIGYSLGLETGLDYTTIKYNSDGIQEWVARYDGPASSVDSAKALAVDDSGDVYVTGCSEGVNTDLDYATVKYNTKGIQEWVARYNGPGNSEDEAIGLVIDDSGNVYVTGYSSGLDTGLDYTTIKYNSNGVQQWAARYNGPANDRDQATAIDIDRYGNIYVTGISMGTDTDYDYATVKYDTEGAQEWIVRYDRESSFDIATDVAVDDSGHVYVTGYSEGSDSAAYVTIKYVQTSAPIGERGDVNGDNDINILDMLAVVNHILGFSPLTDDAQWFADCNGDGIIDLLDLFGIVSVILGTGECVPL